MVQEESEEEEEKEELDEETKQRLAEEEEEKKRQEEEEAAAAAAANPKDKKAAAAQAKKSQPEVEAVDPDLPDPNDPNKDKFLPDLIHFDRTKHQSTEAFNSLVNYQIFLKDEDKFDLVFDDSSYDSRQGDIVDFAFANGLYYLNLKGIGKPERSCKVDRLQEILDELRRIQAQIQE